MGGDGKEDRRAAQRLGDKAAARSGRNVIDAQLLEPPAVMTIDSAVPDVEPEHTLRAEHQSSHSCPHAKERWHGLHGLVEFRIDHAQPLADVSSSRADPFSGEALGGVAACDLSAGMPA